MPYKNEHAARVQNPGKFKTIKRVNNKFGSGIHAIFGKKSSDSPMELQAVRFDKDKYTPQESKDWLKEHEIKNTGFEKASSEEENDCEDSNKKISDKKMPKRKGKDEDDNEGDDEDEDEDEDGDEDGDEDDE
jgi:hypothetical protein